MSRTVQFNIGAGDPERAIGFYQAVFGWSFRPAEGDGDEGNSWLIGAGPGGSGPINGGLSRKQPVGAYVSTMAVHSVDDCASRVKAQGGQVITPKVAVPGVGFLAYCQDTEGNLFGIMQFDRLAGSNAQSVAA